MYHYTPPSRRSVGYIYRYIQLRKMRIKYTLNIIAGLLLIVSCSTQKQQINNVEQPNQITNESFKYDKDFLKYIEAKWDRKTYEKEHLPKFDFLKAHAKQLKIKDESILSKKFMTKPSTDNLIALYVNRKLGWNSFNFEGSKSSTREVIGKELENPPTEEEMLAFYYSTIFIHILNNQRNISPYELNLDFKELGLNEKEGTIMFLSAMRHLGSQISSYSEKSENCWRAIEFVKKIPTFNGVTFDNFELAKFEDFKLDVDKRYPKMSFKERYIPEFEKAKLGFKKCLEIEDKN